MGLPGSEALHGAQRGKYANGGTRDVPSQDASRSLSKRKTLVICFVSNWWLAAGVAPDGPPGLAHVMRRVLLAETYLVEPGVVMRSP